MEEKTLAYLRFIVKRFYFALIITLLFGLAGWYYGQKTPPSYETQAYVTVTQLSYTLLPSLSAPSAPFSVVCGLVTDVFISLLLLLICGSELNSWALIS